MKCPGFCAIIHRVLPLYQKAIIALIFASFGGEIIIFYLKRLLVSSKVKFSFDISGMIERTAVMLVIIIGGFIVLLIPAIVLIRAVSIMGEGSFKNISDIIKREEPAVEFQKIRLKSELGLSLLASPSLGILFGILAKIL